MQFAAIDFETANHRPDSPCQLAVVVVEGGEIRSEHCWLIRPKRLYFSPQCIAVHGILPEQVKDQPQWDKLWPEIFAAIDGRVLLAHNAGFDLRVLLQTLLTYDLSCPELEYSCTRLIARRCWPGRSGYGLKPTADSLGLTFRHHDALEDARVCARIALAAADQVQASGLESLEETLGIMRGRMRYGTLAGPKCIRRNKQGTRELVSDGAPKRFRRDGFPDAAHQSKLRRMAADGLIQATQHRPPLANKHVVLNGSLLGLDRLDAITFLEKLGAIVQPRINLSTDYLIVGHAEQSVQPSGASPEPLSIPSRDADVLSRQEQGQPIRILSQRQLLALIPGGLEAARALAGA